MKDRIEALFDKNAVHGRLRVHDGKEAFYSHIAVNPDQEYPGICIVHLIRYVGEGEANFDLFTSACVLTSEDTDEAVMTKFDAALSAMQLTGRMLNGAMTPVQTKGQEFEVPVSNSGAGQ